VLRFPDRGLGYFQVAFRSAFRTDLAPVSGTGILFFGPAGEAAFATEVASSGVGRPPASRRRGDCFGLHYVAEGHRAGDRRADMSAKTA
jgi:hypothetical protein